MKKTLLTTLLILALFAATAFGANDKKYTYLALGDSIPFGLNPLLLPPYAKKLPSARQFSGYPETVAAVERQTKELNPSCPGETSGSFLDTSSPDYGCNSPHVQTGLPTIPPFKTSIGLKADYTGAQMEFAESQLARNKDINQVTLSIGANDVLLVLPQIAQCGPDTTCAQNILTPVLQTYGSNLFQILTRIRAQYRGKLVLVKYYSPAPALDGLAVAINGVMTQVAAELAMQPGFVPVRFADGFTAFQVASAVYGGDPCQAGLLIRLPPGPNTPPCDIHPSPLGRDILAVIVELALRLP